MWLHWLALCHVRWHLLGKPLHLSQCVLHAPGTQAGAGFQGFQACCRLLVGALFNKKEAQQEGDEHPLEDTARRLLGKLQLFHTVARSGEQARPSAQMRIQGLG